jgi:hypothetical protein
MPALSRVLAITSLSFSALTWLGVLVLYASTLTEPGIVLVVALASAAFLWALLALVIRAHSPLAWLALGTSLVFPIVVWEWLQSLQGASSAKCRLAALR